MILFYFNYTYCNNDFAVENLHFSNSRETEVIPPGHTPGSIAIHYEFVNDLPLYQDLTLH